MPAGLSRSRRTDTGGQLRSNRASVRIVATSDLGSGCGQYFQRSILRCTYTPTCQVSLHHIGTLLSEPTRLRSQSNGKDLQGGQGKWSALE